MTTDFVAMRFERDGPIAHLRLAQPERANAMTTDFWRELPVVLNSCAADSTVRALVISAAGRNFSGGMDLAAFRRIAEGRDAIEQSRWRANFRNNLLRMQDDITRIETLQFPVIAVVQGACVGGALDLICACDMRFASRDAFFVIQETNIGLMPDLGTLPRLSRLMPDGIVRELAFSGRRMNVEEARAYGFVNRVCDDAPSALAAALEAAVQVANRSPNVVWGCKEMLNWGRDHSTADTLQHVAAWQSGAISFDDIDASIDSQRSKSSPPRYSDLHLSPHLLDPMGSNRGGN